MQSPSRIAEHIHKLQTQLPLPESSYYAITFLATDDGKIERYWQSQFKGWADTAKKRELREIAPVYPLKMLQLLEDTGEPGVLVNSREDFLLYFLIGGHGVVEQSLCERFLPDLIKPKEIVRSIAKGFVVVETAPEGWLRRAPSRKDRMRLLKRDNLRCRICGRSPHDYVDIELHLHHVVPWSKGGLTEDDNLVTICGTCHDGLDPHYDPELFSMLGVNTLFPKLTTSAEYKRGIMNYRRISVQAYKEQFLDSKCQRSNNSGAAD